LGAYLTKREVGQKICPKIDPKEKLNIKASKYPFLGFQPPFFSSYSY
jgi:hypothetical protein